MNIFAFDVLLSAGLAIVGSPALAYLIDAKDFWTYTFVSAPAIFMLILIIFLITDVVAMIIREMVHNEKDERSC